MADGVEDWRTLNRAKWDEWVGVHTGPGGYDLDALRRGTARLNALEEGELPPLDGLRVLHLQCHFGRDSLILARRGAAEVVGVDFSAVAVEAARALAAELGVSARFVLSDVYDAPGALPEPGSFDLVYVTWGALCWLPDMAGWARVVAHFLRPGGALYLAEAHPVAMVLGRDGRFEMPYFGREGVRFDSGLDYIDQRAVLANTRSVEWLHPLADVVGALLAARLRLAWLHEHEVATWRMFDALVEGPDGQFRWPDRPWLPLSYSLRAERA